MTAEAGFRCALDPAVPPFNTIGKYDGEVSYDFQPPVLLKIDWRHEEARFLTAHYCTPTKPGWCRHFVRTVCQREDSDNTSTVRSHRWFKLNLFTLTSPAWMTHVVGPTFLHQDMVLLHRQARPQPVRATSLIKPTFRTWISISLMSISPTTLFPPQLLSHIQISPLARRAITSLG